MRRGVRRVLKGMSVFVFLALCLSLLHWIDPGADTLTDFVDARLLAHGLWGHVYFVLLAGALTCLGMPRQVISFVGGYAFGLMLGTLWATLGSTLGCALSFAYARFVGQSSVERRFGRQVGKINTLLGQAPFAMTVCIRLLPIGNNLLTSLLGGVSRIAALPFILGSGVGYIPQNFIFALLGSGVRVDPFWRTVLSAVLFVLSSFLGWWIYRRFRLNRAIDVPADD